MNPNQALWEEGDFTRIAASMKESGEALARTFPRRPSELVAEFKNYYGPTMNAFEAAEKSGRAASFQTELEELFHAQNQSRSGDETTIPATFLRVNVDC